MNPDDYDDSSQLSTQLTADLLHAIDKCVDNHRDLGGAAFITGILSAIAMVTASVLRGLKADSEEGLDKFLKIHGIAIRHALATLHAGTDDN